MAAPWDRLPRGVPLQPTSWYRSPVIPPARPDGSPAFPAQQGDIYRTVPQLLVRRRPLRVLIDNSRANPPRPHEIRDEDDDTVVLEDSEFAVPAQRGLGILLTQDCELDKTRPSLLFARVRPVGRREAREHIELVHERLVYRAFYLPESPEHSLPECIVDFGHLTTVHADAVRHEDRLLSLDDEVRDCLRRDYVAFLMAERENA